MYSRRGQRPERDLERMFMPFSAAGRKGFQSAKMGEQVKKVRNGGKHDGEMDF